MVAVVALVACNRAHDTTSEAVGDASTTSAELAPFRFQRPAEIDAAVAPPPPAASAAPAAPAPEATTRGADRVSIVGSSDHDKNLGLVAADGGAVAPPPAPAPAAPPEPAPTFRPPSAADPVPRNQFGPPPSP